MYSHGFISEPDEWFSEKLAFLRGADEQLEKHLSPFGTNLTDDNLRKDAQINKPLLKRSDFGLPEARPLYLCIQDLGRRHPETDALFAELLKRDKDAFLLVSSHELHFGNPNVFDSFKHSLASYGLKNINERIFRVPLFTNRPKHDYFSFLKLADCLLIFRRFLGGQIFLDTLGQELPVISWPTDDYAGLLSVYRFLGLEELLAKSQDEYINLAMCMAHDKKWATDLQLRLKIGKARYLDYSQRSGFYKQDLSQFLQMAVERARAGLPPAHWRAGQFYDQLNADQLKEFIRAEQNVILNEDY
jgi:predicted O-linked N-acetylglucosamine transferase (SPINDLY family)